MYTPIQIIMASEYISIKVLKAKSILDLPRIVLTIEKTI